MSESAWKELSTRFPRVPAEFRMEAVRKRSRKGTPIQAHARPVSALAFSQDCERLAASGGGLIPGAADIRVFDVATRELRQICHAHVMGVFTLAFDARTDLLASASHDYSVILWDLEQQESTISRTASQSFSSRSVRTMTSTEPRSSLTGGVSAETSAQAAAPRRAS